MHGWVCWGLVGLGWAQLSSPASGVVSLAWPLACVGPRSVLCISLWDPGRWGRRFLGEVLLVTVAEAGESKPPCTAHFKLLFSLVCC